MKIMPSSFNQSINCDLKHIETNKSCCNRSYKLSSITSGSAFTNHSDQLSVSFSERFCRFESYTTFAWINILLSQSEVLLLSNGSNYRKAWRTKPRMFLKMVGKYVSASSNGISPQKLLSS